MSARDYPFAALVGQEQLQLALLLNAVYPGIGGVLVRGEKGTAKSTAARALAALLPRVHTIQGCPFHCDPETPWAECPHCSSQAERVVVDIPAPFVDLPLGATEDRVLGTLDFERALREGRRAFQPGLLAGAHRGVLYIDEVNLLADHLVDVLIDAAAMGVNTVQREGVGVIHPARFLLIGTMNPEEGDLRPQLLDRFGLMVEVVGPRQPEVRTEIVRRRLAFEADPAGFNAGWETAQNALGERLRTARALLPRVALGEDLFTLISQLCCEMGVDGLRADIVLHKTARARAAFQGRDQVTREDVRAAAELVLPHRRRRKPFEQSRLDKDRLEESLSRLSQDQESSPPSETAAETSAPKNGEEPRGNGTSEKDQGPEAGTRIIEAAPPQPVRRLEVVPEGRPGQGPPGRRNATPLPGQGRYRRAVPDEKATDLALDATIRAAVRRGARLENGLAIQPADLHRKERTGQTGTLILFVVDASGSMAARRRMERVKGTVLGLLQSAYELRDQVSVIAFRGPRAEMVLPPTSSVDLAERALRVLPTGGRTPLAHALVLARDAIQRNRRAQPDLPVLLALLSDGKANVPLPDSAGNPWQQALQAAGELASQKVPALVLDTDPGFVRLSRAGELAQALGAELVPLENLSSEGLVLKVRG